MTDFVREIKGGSPISANRAFKYAGYNFLPGDEFPWQELMAGWDRVQQMLSIKRLRLGSGNPRKDILQDIAKRLGKTEKVDGLEKAAEKIEEEVRAPRKKKKVRRDSEVVVRRSK